MGEGIFDGLADLIEEHKKLRMQKDYNAAQWAALNKSEGIDPEQELMFQKGSVGTQSGLLNARLAKNYNAQQKQYNDARIQNLLEAASNRKTMETQRQQDAAQDDAFGRTLAQINSMDGKPDVGAAMKIIGQNAANMGGERTARAMQLIAGLNPDAENPTDWTSSTGNNYVRYHHTLLPDQRNDSDANMASDILDENGDPTGKMRVPTGKGRFMIMTKPSDNSQQPVIRRMLDDKGKPTKHGFIDDGSGKYKMMPNAFEYDQDATSSPAPAPQAKGPGLFSRMYNATFPGTTTPLSNLGAGVGYNGAGTLNPQPSYNPMSAPPAIQQGPVDNSAFQAPQGVVPGGTQVLAPSATPKRFQFSNGQFTPQ